MATANPFAQYAPKPADEVNPFAQFAAPTDTAGPLTKFGRAAASLADTTIGGVIPAVVGQLAYPVTRLFTSPERAEQIAQTATGAVDAPFGRAFGVTGTPEYQGETSRRILGYVGGKVQQGSNVLAGATGLPAQDVQNMLNTGLLAVPGGARAVKQGVRAAGEAISEIPAVKARAERTAQAQSSADWARAPKIEAAQAADRLGLSLNPAESNPTRTTRTAASIAGNEVVNRKIAAKNAPRLNEIAREDMGLPPNTPLDAKAFETARAAQSGPYTRIGQMGTMTADADTLANMNSIRVDSLVNPDKAAAINGMVDRIASTAAEGMNGNAVIKTVGELRNEATRTLRRPDAKPLDVELADAQLKLAGQLESMVEGNITNPKALQEWRDARTAMAKTYDWERATGVTTRQVDPAAIMQMAEKGRPLTGKLREVADVAGNYPGSLAPPKSEITTSLQRAGRGTAGGAVGAGIGYTVGGPLGALAGGITGGALSEGVANALTSRRGQNMLATPADRRIPLPVEPTPLGPAIPQNRAIVPFDPANAVVPPAQPGPNFVLRPNEYGPRVTTSMPPPGPAALPAPSAEGTMGALRAEDVRRSGVSRALGQEAEARQAAAEAAARRPTSGELILDLDPVTGRLREASQGVRGATPETFTNFGSALETAATKVTSGKLFDMTAAEKVAWDKTRADLAEVAPGFKTLTDKAVAEKMLDRKWIADTVTKARQKAAAFDELSSQIKDAQLRRDAMASRERLLDLADQMEEGLRAPRPVQRGGQGPKTRAAQQNRLHLDYPDVSNALIKE